MSNTNKKAKDLSTNSDKLIKSTLFLLQDNKNKLHLISKLKGVTNLIEGLALDNDQKLDVIQSINDVSSSIKESYEATKLHIKRVNPSAYQTEEAYERIQKSNKENNNNIADILFSMHKTGITEPQLLRVEIPKTKANRQFKIGRPDYVNIPLPKNGSTCKPLEIWDIFHNLKQKEGDKCYKHLKIPLIKALTKRNNGKALVPISESGLTRHLSKQKNMINNAWSVVGRKKLAGLKDVTNVIFEKAKNNPGLGVPEDEISNIIIKQMAKKAGNVNYSPSKRTMNRYMNEVKVSSILDGRFSVTNAGIKKDMHRYTSENSLRNALNYAVAVLSTHFILGEELEKNIYNNLSDDAKSTIEMVRKLNNNEKVKPLHPDQIFGSDDTSIFVYSGNTKNKKHQWKIIDKDSLSKMGTHSAYEISEDNKLTQGIRIKMMCTYSASGYAAPLCLVVSGLDETELIMTDEELERSRGIYVMKIEGFSMHASIDPLNKSYGYIIFMRSSKNETYSADESRYDFCNDEIFYPFVNGIRKLKYPEWYEGSEPTPNMTIVAWCDGDIGQISNILSDKVASKDLLNKIIRNKHSPKRSGSEAACDLMNSFKSIKTVTKILTMNHDPDTIMSSNVNEAITKDTRLNLKKSKQKILCDFCGCTPEIMVRSNTQRAIRKGFIENGMIDESLKLCPSFTNMMKTMPKKLGEKTIEIMNNFEIMKKLHDEYQLKFRITEEFFDELGIPNDVNIRGEIISELRRSEFVSRQRCQTLNTIAHYENRKQQKESILNEKIRQYEIIKSKTETFTDNAKEAESKIHSVLTTSGKKLRQYLSNSSRKIRIKQTKDFAECKINFNHVPIEVFQELNVRQLTGFAAVRNITNIDDLKKYFDSIKINKWPNKGTLAEAMNGNLNLIKLAFDSRNECSKLILKTFNEIFPNQGIEKFAKPLVNEVLLRRNDKNEIKMRVEKMILDDEWRKDVWNFIDSMGVFSPDDKLRNGHTHDVELAVEMHYAFLVRLEHLINNRVLITKKKHWVWDFVRDNILTMSCIIILQQHVINVDLVKLAQNNTNICVLDCPSNKFTRHVESSAAEGVYLFYDRVKKEWIRSGKCTGRPIQKRLEEHAMHAKSKKDTFFYRSYPLADTAGYRGKYEWLDVYLGLGCNPSTDKERFLHSFTHSNKFCWKAASNAIKYSSNPTRTKYNCLAYLFECCYDLMLSAASNVSQNPGFESFTGQH